MIYKWNNKIIPSEDLAPWQIYILRCCKHLNKWTLEMLKDFLELNMNDKRFYIGTRGQKSKKNVRKYWEYIHSDNIKHHVPNVESYYVQLN